MTKEKEKETEKKPAPAPINNGKALVTDALGRTIAIRKLNALDKMRLFEALGSELSANNHYFMYAFAAASVTAIDTALYAFPRTKRDVEEIVGKLDEDGLAAVIAGASENFYLPTNTVNLDEVKN